MATQGSFISTKALGQLIASSTGLLMPIESGGSAQGSLLAWDATAPASLRDTSRPWNCLLTDVVGILLKNTAPSDDINTVQYSPIVKLGGAARKTNATAESQTQGWGIQNRPKAGAASTSSSLHFLWENNGAAWASKANITHEGRLTLSDSIYAPLGRFNAGAIYIVGEDSSVGIGTAQVFKATYSSGPIGLIHKDRADGTNNIICATVYDRNAASVTNEDTMALMAEGWTNNSDALTVAASRSPSGNSKFCGRINGQRFDIKSLTELTTIAAAAYTDTAIQIPANCIVVGIDTRITVQPTGTTTTDIGNSSTADAYGDDISTVAGVTNTKHVLAVNSAALSIRYTPNTTPSDNAGRVRTTIYYMQITAASS